MSAVGGKAPSKRAGRAKGPNRGQVKTKIIVRRLPANLPEHVFMDSIKSLAPETSLERSTTWVSGKISKNPVKGNTFARAYIYFKNEKSALEFQKAYHGHVFMDRHGNEGRAYVEFAPFQKVPRDQRKTDAKQGTIEEDPEYIAFLQSLNAEPVEAEKEMKLSETELLLKETAVNPKSTPLLEALRAQKAAAQAKAQAAKIAARQARQAGKSGASNATKGQITILTNRNSKETANNRAQPSGASTSTNKNQQVQQGKASIQPSETESGQGSKPKRERRRRDRASKKAATEGPSGAAGDTNATVPQVTLLKSKPASIPPASAPSQNASNHVESKQTNNTPSHGNQGQSSSGSRRGQQSQNQGGQQQGGTNPNSIPATKKDSTQTVNADGGPNRSGKSRRNRGGERGERAKQDPKVVGAGATGISGTGNNSSNATNSNAPANKGQEAQGSGGSNRQGRTRRGRGGGGGGGGSQETPSGPSVQG